MQAKDSTSCFISLVHHDQTPEVGRPVRLDMHVHAHAHARTHTHLILPDKKATFSLRMGSTSIALISSFLLKPA